MTQEDIKRIQTKHRMEAVQARNRRKERNERTRRLIQEGAILESVLPCAAEIPLKALRAELTKRLGEP